MKALRNIASFCFVTACVFLFAVGSGGCSDTTSVAAIEREEAASPEMIKAVEAESAGDIQKAFDILVNITTNTPSNGLAHLKLAILLQDCKNDPESAITHFHRYLFLRPNAQKSDMVNEKIKLAEHMIRFPYGPGATAQDISIERKKYKAEIDELKKAVAAGEERIRILEEEKTVMKTEIKKLEDRNSQLYNRVQIMETKGTVSPPTPKKLSDVELVYPVVLRGEKPVVPDTSVKRTWEVKRGDTLWSIAQRFYGDASRSDDIRDANKKKLGSNDQLAEGMILVIP